MKNHSNMMKTNLGILVVIIILLMMKSGMTQTSNIMLSNKRKHFTLEQGFLPGKKFPIFSTIEDYDFQGLRLKVEIYDDREKLKLESIKCSDIRIKNKTEFSSPQTIFKIQQYVDTLFSQSKILIDSTSSEKIEIRLEALDSRLIGFGVIKVHGLCQMKIRYNDFEKVYCTDIVDGHEHSPLGAKAFVTRKTATRYMASASIRENIEQFLIDLKEKNKSR